MNWRKFLFALIETYMPQLPKKFLSDVDQTHADLDLWWGKLEGETMLKLKKWLDHPLLRVFLIFLTIPVGKFLQRWGDPKDEILDEEEDGQQQQQNTMTN